MNTFLLSALCLLGAWATLTGGVIVKVSSLSPPFSRLLSTYRVQGLSSDKATPPWGLRVRYV